MNESSQRRFEPSSPLLRTLFAAVAVVATLSTGAFIDALAHGAGLTATQGAYVVIARR